ncbi:MAG: TPD domain-containing protein [Archaeoglobaceae archaeon]
MKLPLQDYLEIRKKINKIADLNKFNLPRGVLHSILLQKKVENVKKKYHLFVEKKMEILKYWKENKKFPEWLTLTPVMKVRLLLNAMGFSTKEINMALRRPEILDNDLSKVVYRAVSIDFIYSPIAIKLQSVLGEIGEKIVEEELKRLRVRFKREKELRMQKTPDFLLEEPVEIFGKKIRWIESKALFADHRIYELYSRKQFIKYREIFGEGMTIFWRGCVEGIDVSDGSEFHGELKRKLLEMEIKVKRSEEVNGSPIELAEDFLAKYAEQDSFPYNAEVVRILRNMGLIVKQED